MVPRVMHEASSGSHINVGDDDFLWHLTGVGRKGMHSLGTNIVNSSHPWMYRRSCYCQGQSEICRTRPSEYKEIVKWKASADRAAVTVCSRQSARTTVFVFYPLHSQPIPSLKTEPPHNDLGAAFIPLPLSQNWHTSTRFSAAARLNSGYGVAI